MREEVRDHEKVKEMEAKWGGMKCLMGEISSYQIVEKLGIFSLIFLHDFIPLSILNLSDIWYGASIMLIELKSIRLWFVLQDTDAV